jgi:glutamate:Na+ symporter, ESS family
MFSLHAIGFILFLIAAFFLLKKIFWLRLPAGQKNAFAARLSALGISAGVAWLLLSSAFAALAQEADAEEITYDFQDVFYAFVILGLLILVGRFIRQKIGLLQKLFIPSSIVAGLVALLLGGEALGAIATTLTDAENPLANGLFPAPIQEVWAASPGVFINVVFAALFLGQPIPSPGRIWQQAAPQVVLGQVIAWGQYVIGLLVALLILVPFFDMSPISGALIEMSFEGGHGTAAGMAETLSGLGFEEGGDMALGLATVGIVTAIIAGTALADWARRKGHVQTEDSSETVESGQTMANASGAEMQLEEGQISTEDYQHRPDGTWRELLIDPLSLHFGYVGLAIAIGWLILQGLIWLESVTWNAGGEGLEILGNIPLFPLALIGGILVQLGLEKMGRGYLVSPRLMNRIAGVALDVTVVTALASISLTVLGANLAPFLILAVVGVAWSIFAFVYLAPRIFPSYWFEKGIADMGQSMGVTATGLVLLQIVDKDNRSGAYESFGYKQLFFEPIVGGGLFTGAAPTLINQFGLVPVLGLTAAILVGWLVFGYLAFWRKIGSRLHS